MMYRFTRRQGCFSACFNDSLLVRSSWGGGRQYGRRGPGFGQATHPLQYLLQTPKIDPARHRFAGNILLQKLEQTLNALIGAALSSPAALFQ